ncbi:hypothetical protein H4R33_004986 [Dimargaris cristalligena]|uniref:Conserved oligomeric Golgi complex subunit 8 n=1 Tax=Dimargaris cristalligena TaxID=215637 RepID=A0A4Q0A3G9_9FUNG|nr:hypothetical protein H4R33_004986 [Dimargaris cristalligena]RKP39962.1 hypothetical protein BJ085DRAFT_28115 [Dimargaris cristalligena]|eukprot:RKP39962.1 hypothetical protein BJ085DRAFT_28115 [Dimargaris cristalligena]
MEALHRHHPDDSSTSSAGSSPFRVPAGDPATDAYLRYLTSLSLATARNEPSLLAEELDSLNQELMQLCLDESLTFQHAQAYHQALVTGVARMADRGHRAIADRVPALRTAGTDFLDLARRIETQKKRVVHVVQTHLDAVVGILELPQVMQTCIIHRRYPEAIELTLRTRQLRRDLVDRAQEEEEAEEKEEERVVEGKENDNEAEGRKVGGTRNQRSRLGPSNPLRDLTARRIVERIAEAVEDEFRKLVVAICDELGQAPLSSTLLALTSGSSNPVSHSSDQSPPLDDVDENTTPHFTPPTTTTTALPSSTHTNTTRQLLHHTKLLGLLRKTQTFSNLELRTLILRAKQRHWLVIVQTLAQHVPPTSSPYAFAARLLDLSRDFLVDLSTQYAVMFTGTPPVLPALDILPGVLMAPSEGIDSTSDGMGSAMGLADNSDSDSGSDSDIESTDSSLDSAEGGNSSDEAEKANVAQRTNTGRSTPWTIPTEPFAPLLPINPGSLPPQSTPPTKSGPGTGAGTRCPLLHDFYYQFIHQVQSQLASTCPHIADGPSVNALREQIHSMGATLERFGLDFRSLLVFSLPTIYPTTVKLPDGPNEESTPISQ